VKTNNEEGFLDIKESLKSSSSIEQQTLDIKVNMKLVRLNYPKVHKKKSLPQPKEKEKSVSLWSIVTTLALGSQPRQGLARV